MTINVDVVGGLTAEVDAVVGPGASVQATLNPTTTVELVGAVPGPPGPQGPPGPAGPAAAGSHTHVQGVASDVWVIVHPLAYFPNVTVIDSANEQVEGDVIYGPLGTISILFSGAFAGTAYLS
jgi:hypothetical protein